MELIKNKKAMEQGMILLVVLICAVFFIIAGIIVWRSVSGILGS